MVETCNAQDQRTSDQDECQPNYANAAGKLETGGKPAEDRERLQTEEKPTGSGAQEGAWGQGSAEAGWGGGEAEALTREKPNVDGTKSEVSVCYGEKHYTEALSAASKKSANLSMAIVWEQGEWPKPIQLNLGHMDQAVETRLEEARRFRVAKDSGVFSTNINQKPNDEAEKFCKEHAEEISQDKLTLEEWVMAFGIRLPILTNLLQALFEYVHMTKKLGMPEPPPEVLEKMLASLGTTGELKKERLEAEGVQAQGDTTAQDVVNSATGLLAHFHGYRKQMRTAEKELDAKRGIGWGEKADRIEEVINIFGKIGSFADAAIGVAGKKGGTGKAKEALEKGAKALSLPTSFEDAYKLAASLPYLDELDQIASQIDKLEAHKDILEELDAYDEMKAHELGFMAANGAYGTAVKKLVGSGNAEPGALANQESQYAKLGSEMDDFAEGQDDMATLAPGKKGGERYETLLAVVGKLKTAGTLSDILLQIPIGKHTDLVSFQAEAEGLQTRRGKVHERLSIERFTPPRHELAAVHEIQKAFEMQRSFANELTPYKGIVQKISAFTTDPGVGVRLGGENSPKT